MYIVKQFRKGTRLPQCAREYIHDTVDMYNVSCGRCVLRNVALYGWVTLPQGLNAYKRMSLHMGTYVQRTLDVLWYSYFLFVI